MSRTAKSRSTLIAEQKRAGEALISAGKTDVVTSGDVTEKKTKACATPVARNQQFKSKSEMVALSSGVPLSASTDSVSQKDILLQTPSRDALLQTRIPSRDAFLQTQTSSRDGLLQTRIPSRDGLLQTQTPSRDAPLQASPRAEHALNLVGNAQSAESVLTPTGVGKRLSQPSSAVDMLYHTKTRADECLVYASNGVVNNVYATRLSHDRLFSVTSKGSIQVKAHHNRKRGDQKRFLLENNFGTAAKKSARVETSKHLQPRKFFGYSMRYLVTTLASQSNELDGAGEISEAVSRGRRLYRRYRSIKARGKGKSAKAGVSRARAARVRSSRMRIMRERISRRTALRKVVKTRIVSRFFSRIAQRSLLKLFMGFFHAIMPALLPIFCMLLISGVFGAFAAQNTSHTLPPYITSEMVETALEAQERYGHPAGATIAQIILESGMGNHLSRLAEEENNLFGMKSGGPDGGYYRGHPEVSGSRLWDTHEHYDGESVEIQDYFLSFTSAKDCILFRSRVFLQHSTYADNPLIKEAIETHSSDKMAEGLKSAGYATSDSYVSDLRGILDAYNLRRFDGLSLRDFQESKQTIIGALADGLLSEAQQKVITQAYATTSPGKGFCAKYISWVFRDAGYGYPTGDARDMYSSWCQSSDLSELRPGMICAVPSYGDHPSPGYTYGHIGIYVGGGRIRDNIGAIRDSDLSDWLRYYGTTHTPKWGWVFGIDLSTQ